MKKQYTLIVSLFLLFTLGGCHPYYTAKNFDEKTEDHVSIAVMPVEMLYTGRQPKDLTEADIREIETAESQAFQVSLVNEILRSTKNNRRPIRVDVQSYNKTQNLLADAGYDIQSSWDLQAEELQEILGVDAVVKSRIQKTRYLTDLESYGLDLATNIINQLTNWQAAPWIPNTPAKEIKADYNLYDTSDGSTLWSINFEQEADWRLPSNEIIDNISRRAARRFPYR